MLRAVRFTRQEDELQGSLPAVCDLVVHPAVLSFFAPANESGERQSPFNFRGACDSNRVFQDSAGGMPAGSGERLGECTSDISVFYYAKRI